MIVYTSLFLTVLLAIAPCQSSVISAKIDKSKTDHLFPLSIIHLNDLHARYEEINNASSKCKPDDGEVCIGGYARIIATVKRLKEEKAALNPIYLNAGDNFQGTLWYTLLRWNVTKYMLNLVPADAMTIGNHEFDNGVAGLAPFLDTIESTIVIANLDVSQEPTLVGRFQKSKVIIRGDRKIGIIGVIIKSTPMLSVTEKVIFLDEEESVQAEATKLKTEGVDIIILLSHCGLVVDKRIARNVGPEIDIIVGGHSHTLLYNGTSVPGPDIPGDTYPAIVEQSNGHKVLIVQASAYSKYLGDITVYFDEKGEAQEWTGNPIFMDHNVPKDPEIERELVPWRNMVDTIGEARIGTNKVYLQTRAECANGECNFGSLICDAFVDYFVDSADDEDSWTYGTISLTNAGGIRTGLLKGHITYNDLATALPFENTIDTFELQGVFLLAALEYSAADYKKVNFLQLSGVHVVYNVTQPIGTRVKSAVILCRQCDVPFYEPLQLEKMYRIISPSWIGSGGNGFTMFGEHRQNFKKGILDIDLVERYIKKISPIVYGLDGRIKIVK